MNGRAPDGSLHAFVLRVLVLLTIAAATLFVWQIRTVLLLFFGAGLLAIGLDAARDRVARLTRLGPSVSLGIVVLLVLALFAVVGWLFGAQLVNQSHYMLQAIPTAWASLRSTLERQPLGAMLLRGMDSGLPDMSSVAVQLKRVTVIASDVLVTFVLLGFGAVYLAANPSAYRDGVLKLVPPAARERAAGLIEACTVALRHWLLAQLVVMVMVGTLTGIGLAVIGVPAALALGLVTGLLEFVPFAGPIAAAVPGTLLAFAVSPVAALEALAVYTVVQQLESNVFAPIVANRMLKLPPALVLFAVVSFGLVFGPLGWIFAMPLTVVLVVTVGRLYVRETLKTSTAVPGDERH